MTPQELRSNLRMFTGCEQPFKHAISKMLYTDGVQYFAKNAGAYWFLDIVGTEVLPQGHEFAVVKLVSKDSKGTVVVEDGKDNFIWQKAIDYTDAPVGVWSFYLINGMLLLPSEY